MIPLRKAKHGFTLVEVIGVIVVIGILTALAGIGIAKLYRASQDSNAIGKAEGINQAKLSYKMRVPSAYTNWSSASSDAARFLLVRDRVPFGNTATLGTYQPSGYTFTLGATLDVRVGITDPDGNSVSY